MLARQRRGELERLNEQLRQINAALRRQAKIESYAPTLSYAPIGGRIPENEVIVDSRKQELISRLKAGKNFLRNQEPDKAFVEFKTALELAQNLKDAIEEKKAARGLGLFLLPFCSLFVRKSATAETLEGWLTLLSAYVFIHFFSKLHKNYPTRDSDCLH